jgi:hypothetical protein
MFMVSQPADLALIKFVVSTQALSCHWMTFDSYPVYADDVNFLGDNRDTIKKKQKH